ncbi:hypothetical protein D3C80_2178760 [compost metagenome]
MEDPEPRAAVPAVDEQPGGLRPIVVGVNSFAKGNAVDPMESAGQTFGLLGD